jgi:hypothetical protein
MLSIKMFVKTFLFYFEQPQLKRNINLKVINKIIVGILVDEKLIFTPQKNKLRIFKTSRLSYL